MRPAAGLAYLFCIGSLLAAEPSRPKVKAFVQEVVLGTEYGDGKKAVARWTAAPTLSVFGATPEQKAVVVEVISHINPALKDHVGEIRLLADNSDAARMKVYFLPYKDFATTATRHKASYPPPATSATSGCFGTRKGSSLPLACSWLRIGCPAPG